jgi:hypothetical protein
MQAHPHNIDAAQREIDRRAAEGEDMSGATIDPVTSAVVLPSLRELLGPNVAPAFVDAAEDARLLALADELDPVEACEFDDDGERLPVDYRDDPAEREQWQFDRYCDAHPDYLDNAL